MYELPIQGNIIADPNYTQQRFPMNCMSTEKSIITEILCINNDKEGAELSYVKQFLCFQVKINGS